MKRISLGLAVVAVAGIAAALPASAASATTTTSAADPGPETCRQGYVWRVSRPSDLVCVAPGTRDQVAADNAARFSRWTNGAYGPHTCKVPYVWRNAYSGDDVCVVNSQRTLAASDNAAGNARKVLARLWITKYTIPPKDNGDGTATKTSVDDISRLKLNGSHYNLGQVKLVIRWNHNDAVFWSGSVNAKSHSGYAGGSFGYKTGKFDCSAPGKPANAYAYAYDTQSGRYSARVPVRIGCAVL
ncbi:hypothetical protein [Nonomuraea rhizosphaerae]|uniref:hypothetical protein n=1 Tax=Nonomuraea rhizosphaerae TaxID=2665663 RepID=UPI001C5DC8B0|nr:hypothetical protein [Nonomuraea rhizosphaerae]